MISKHGKKRMTNLIACAWTAIAGFITRFFLSSELSKIETRGAVWRLPHYPSAMIQSRFNQVVTGFWCTKRGVR